MKIGNYLRLACSVVALLLASGIVALASDSGLVVLNHDVVVHGKTLPAGRYQVRWTTDSPTATVEFKNRNNVVLSTEGVFVDRGRAYARNQYVTDAGTDGTAKLLEVRFAGSSKVLTFN